MNKYRYFKSFLFFDYSERLIPIPVNNVLFERVKARIIDERKWVRIALIRTHLRSLLAKYALASLTCLALPNRL